MGRKDGGGWSGRKSLPSGKIRLWQNFSGKAMKNRALLWRKFLLYTTRITFSLYLPEPRRASLLIFTVRTW
jgi:hypothetical protein